MSKTDMSSKAPAKMATAAKAVQTSAVKRTVDERKLSYTEKVAEMDARALARTNAIKAAALKASINDDADREDLSLGVDYGDEGEEGEASPSDSPEVKRARTSSTSSPNAADGAFASGSPFPDDESREATPHEENEETRHGGHTMEEGDSFWLSDDDYDQMNIVIDAVTSGELFLRWAYARGHDVSQRGSDRVKTLRTAYYKLRQEGGVTRSFHKSLARASPDVRAHALWGDFSSAGNTAGAGHSASGRTYSSTTWGYSAHQAAASINARGYYGADASARSPGQGRGYLPLASHAAPKSGGSGRSTSQGTLVRPYGFASSRGSLRASGGYYPHPAGALGPAGVATPGALGAQVQTLLAQMKGVLATQADLSLRLRDVEGRVHDLRGQMTRRVSTVALDERLAAMKDELHALVESGTSKLTEGLTAARKGLAAEQRLAAKRVDPRVDTLVDMIACQTQLVSALSDDVARLLAARASAGKIVRPVGPPSGAEEEKPVATFVAGAVEAAPKEGCLPESKLTQPCDTA